jgi:hypothetical protein
MTGSDPFTTLGLPADPGLTDEQVRAAWRSIATSTHPDRPDGGDPARYAAASAAYAALRTPWARSEAYADLASHAPPAPRAPARPAARRSGMRATGAVRLTGARVRHGRPVRLAVRVLAAALLALIVARSGAGGPATAGVVSGLGIWLVLTARGDLAPPPGR